MFTPKHHPVKLMSSPRQLLKRCDRSDGPLALEVGHIEVVDLEVAQLALAATRVVRGEYLHSCTPLSELRLCCFRARAILLLEGGVSGAKLRQ